MTSITLPRAVVQQVLDSINELFAAEQSEGGERGGHIRTPATREHLVRVAQARKALHESCGALRAALAQQDEPVQEPVAWKQGNLVTFNEDPYPALGGLFVQFWDGEEVAARVYANDLKTLRQRCAKVNAAPPQRTMVPLTEEEIDAEWHELDGRASALFKRVIRKFARAVEKASWEKNHGQA